MIRALFVIAAGLGVFGLAQLPPHAGSGPEAKLELQNEAVHVLRIRIAPREHIPMHEVTPRVVVWLTDAQLRDTLADGTTRDMRAKAGQVEWVPAQRHAGENLGDRPVEFLAIIPKGTSSRAAHNR